MEDIDPKEVKKVDPDAELTAEIVRVVRGCGGSIPLGSFFLHRPDLKKVLGDRKFKEFVEERAELFELVEPPVLVIPEQDADFRTNPKKKSVPFGGRCGITLKLKDNNTTDTTMTDNDNTDFTKGSTSAGKTALNVLLKVATAEIAAMKAKFAKGEKEVDPRNIHPESGGIRIGYASNGFKLRKKIRTAYTLAPHPGVNALHPTPSSEHQVECNRVAMLFSFYFLKFLEATPDVFQVVDGPADDRCGPHHMPSGRCSCNTYVNVNPSYAFLPDGEGEGEGDEENRKSSKDPTRYDRQMAERLSALLRGTNPRKGVDVAWLGQDPKIKKYVCGRPLLAVIKTFPDVDVFERDGRHVARTKNATLRLEADDGEKKDGDVTDTTQKRRKYTPDHVAVPQKHLDTIGHASGLYALNKPPNFSTEQILHAYGTATEDRTTGERDTVISISRLDKETSGVLIFATSDASAEYMKTQYVDHKVDKKYTALCCGYTPISGRIESKLLLSDMPGRTRVRVHPKGKDSITEYVRKEKYRSVPPGAVSFELRAAVMCLQRGLGKRAVAGVLNFMLPFPTGSERFSLLECTPLTGRTHQIRVHMTSKGHPLVSDSKYGKGNQSAKQRTWCERCFLHCSEVGGLDIDQGRYKMVAEVPKDLQQALCHLLPC